MILLIACALLLAPAVASAQDTPSTAPANKAPPERTYSNTPFLHRIVLLDEEGNTIRIPKPGEEGATPAAKPLSLAKTCGKCHSDYDAMQQGWHANFSDKNAPHGRPGEPWILTDLQTRTQLPLSYRGWKGTFHPYDVGINDFNFARLFGRHHTGGGALQTSGDLRFRMSGPLENDCLICHVSDGQYDTVARAQQIATDQNFKYAPTLAAFIGKVQGSASKLRDNFDPAGPDARRAPKINFDTMRFDELSQTVVNLAKRVPNERCYFCHTNVDVGGKGKENAGLESRWRHDRDIHLAKGMLCVDCHRNGADHMIVRGYEGELDDRIKAQGEAKADKTIATLSCQGCHYGNETQSGGRLAAPRPVHHGLPTLHFEKLTCTACHSGPAPEDAASLVQTAMAHKLGLPRHRTTDDAGPVIQQPVFLHDAHTGKIAPFRMIYPSFWGRMNGDKITPIAPEVVAAVAGEILGEKPDAKEAFAVEPLTEEQIAQAIGKIAAAEPVAIKPPDVISARNPTTAPTAATASAGEVVFITGGKAYKRLPDGKGIAVFHTPAAEPYAWALAHDVRGAQQALGARGCVECHTNGSPIFDGKIASASLLVGAASEKSMHDLRGDSIASLRLFAATYRLRWPLIWLGYLSATVLLLIYLKQKLRTIGNKG